MQNTSRRYSQSILPISLFLLIFLPILLPAQPSKSDIFTIDIDKIIKVKSEIKTSELCSSVSYFILENPSKPVYIPIDAGQKLYTKYLIFGNLRNHEVSLFTRDGRFVTLLNFLGKGPGEYTGWTDFGLTPDEKKIWLFDRYSNQIYFYDLTGRWISTVRLPTKVLDVFIDQKGNIISTNFQFLKDEFDSYAFLVFDPKGKVIHKLLKYKPKSITPLNYFGASMVYQTDFGRLIKPGQENDTIYRLNDDYTTDPFLVLNYKKTNKSANQTDEDGYAPASPVFDLTIYSLQSFSGRNLLMAIRYQGRGYTIILNPVTGETRCSEKIADDLFGKRSMGSTPSQDGRDIFGRNDVQYAKENPTYIFDNEDVKYADLQREVKAKIKAADENTDNLMIIFKKK